VTLLEALRDPNLFGRFFKGASWAKWKVFLAALIASAPQGADDLAVFQTCTSRTTWPTSAFAEAVLIVGRRGGKSRTLALLAVYLACFKDYEPYLAPGEVATIAVLAANRSQARVIFRFVLGLLKAVPLLESLIVRHDTESIVLSNRVVIEIATASFRTSRGYSFAAVLCDETAFWYSDEASANPDVEILRALRPGLANIPGAMLLIASSPYAKRGELYGAFRRHYGRDDARVLVWKADTQTMNPSIDRRIIDEAYESDPESAKAEFGASFRDDLADYITIEAVEAVTCWGRHELPPQEGVAYRAFYDSSGGRVDAMTLAIAHLDGRGVCVLDAVLEVRPPFDPSAALNECVALCRRYGVASLIGDRYAGEWPVARFKECGIELIQSARPKSDIYVDFLPLINAGQIELLDHPRLRAQLVGLERRTARSGKDSVDHAPGGHDDLANVVAGALVGLDLDRRPALVSMQDVALEAGEVTPEWFRLIYLTIVAEGADVAVVACGMNLLPDGEPEKRLWVLDAYVVHLRPRLFADLWNELGHSRRALIREIFAPAPLAAQLSALGLDARPLAEEFDPEPVIPFAAECIGRGLITFSAPVLDKMKSQTIGAALGLRAGDPVETVLRAAFLAAIWIAYGAA
jgi:hypothetical protein